MVHGVVSMSKKAESESNALSVHYLSTDFIALLEAEGLGKGNRINDFEEKIIRGKSCEVLCPRDSVMGSAFVDTVHGEDNVGPATHMLSYTWKYRIGDIVDSLQHWSTDMLLDPKRLDIWMCWACVNQHRVQEMRQKGEVVPFEQFKEVFEGRVKSIGKVIALMMPWYAPAYLERSWCMLEYYTAIELGEACELIILMPPKEEEQWTMNLMNGDGFQQIYKTLREASISCARASVPADQENILRLVDNGRGRQFFDEQIKKHLQSWFLRSASKHVKELPLKMLKACSQVGKLLSAFSSLDEAASILDFGLSTKESLITWNVQSQMRKEQMAVVVGNIWHERGWIEHKRGLHQSATEMYSKGLDELQLMGASKSIAGSMLLRGRARALVRDEPDEFFTDYCPSREDLDKALKDYQISLEILQAQGLQDTEEGAKTYNNLGLLHSLRSEFEKSADMFEAAGRVRTLTGTLQMPMNARRLYNFGSMRLKQGRLTRDAGSANTSAKTGTDASSRFMEAKRLLQEAVNILKDFEVKDDLVKLCHRKLAWIQSVDAQLPGTVGPETN